MIEKLPPELTGAVIAVVMAIVRVLGDDKENKLSRVVLESIICGALSLTFSYAILALGISLFWSAFVGGMVGYLGSTTVKEFAIKFINLKFKK